MTVAMKSNRYIYAAPLAFLMCSGVASAQTSQWCAGTLNGVIAYSNGDVAILGSWRGDWTTVCNTLTVYQGVVQPTICKSWYGALLAAQAAQLQVTIQYPSAPACNALPTADSSPAPSYLRVGGS